MKQVIRCNHAPTHLPAEGEDRKSPVLLNPSTRKIYISGNIDQEVALDIVGEINTINSIDDTMEGMNDDYTRKPITLYINSPGGSVYDMMAIIGTIEESKTPIDTVCTGYAMSAAFIIFLAGRNRSATKWASFMYHELYTCSMNKLTVIKEAVRESDRLQKEMDRYVITKTNIPQSKLDEVRSSKQDWFISYNEACELGIVNT